MGRVALIGLDALEPGLVFERWRDRVPVLDGLMRDGDHARLRSCEPPITVPAWSCMLSGRDPGELGIYGFRNRSGRGYDELTLATSADVRVPRIWDSVGQAGGRSIVIGMPGTYPAAPLDGWLITDLMTPGPGSPCTWPPPLREELFARFPDYRFDVVGHRGSDRTALLAELYAMTRERFAAARWLATTRDWDLLAVHEIATDRIHHAFWATLDPSHPAHDPEDPCAGVIADFYEFVDEQVGRLVDALPPDTDVIVASDHGAQSLLGGFRVNEWLIQQGYLRLHDDAPAGPERLQPAAVDWARTSAWGEGGYYARIFVNVAGREPGGTVAPEHVPDLLAAMTADLAGLTSPDGAPLVSAVHRPADLYRAVRGLPPDLIVVLRDYAWRSLATVGTGELFATANDTGADEANHALDGLLIVRLAGRSAHLDHARRLELFDVAPTVADLLGVPSPAADRRNVLVADDDPTQLSAAETHLLTERLRLLGYL